MNWPKYFNTFMHVATKKSISNAAKAINLPQSTVTKHIQLLEEYLETDLLMRSSRSFSLTESGNDLYIRGKGLLTKWKTICEDISHHSNKVSGNIRLDTEHRLHNENLAIIIEEFISQYPEIKIHHRDLTKPNNIETSGADLYFGSLPPLTSETKLIKRSLGKLPRCCVASEEYIQKHGMPTHPDELISYPCVTYKGAQCWKFKNTSFPINSIVNTNSPHLLLKLIHNGVGLGVIPTPLIDTPNEDKKLIPLLTKWSADNVEFSLYNTKKTHTPLRVKLFIYFCIKSVDEKKLIELKKYFSP